MGKGILIILIVFICVGIIHFISMRTIKISQEKKSIYRKVFYYLYGFVFLAQGIVNMIEKGEFIIISILMSLIGLTILILNFLGKIETRTKVE